MGPHSKGSKTALSAEVMAKRKAWTLYMRDELGYNAGWSYMHVIWTDL